MFGPAEILIILFLAAFAGGAFLLILFFAMKLTRTKPHPPPTPTATRLEELAALHRNGKIDDDEYARLRRKILDEV